MGFFKSDITLDCTENAKKFSISDIQHVFSTLESLVLLTQYIPIDILVRTESLSAYLINICLDNSWLSFTLFTFTGGLDNFYFQHDALF